MRAMLYYPSIPGNDGDIADIGGTFHDTQNTDNSVDYLPDDGLVANWSNLPSMKDPITNSVWANYNSFLLILPFRNPNDGQEREYFGRYPDMSQDGNLVPYNMTNTEK